MKTSINCGPELAKIKEESGNYGFSKRLNVIAERYLHLIHMSGCGAMRDDDMDILAAVPGILTMRASKIEHLPTVILNAKLEFPRHEIVRCAKAISDMSVLQRMIQIERLRNHGH